MMSRLRFFLLLSIISLSGVFLLERFNEFLLPGFGFGIQFTVVVFLAGIAGIATTGKWRFPLPAAIMFWSAIYIAATALWNSAGGFRDNITISLVELILLVWFTALSYLIGSETTLNESYYSPLLTGIRSSKLITLEESQSIIRSEFTRSRHYNRHLSVLAIAQPKLSSGKGGMKTNRENLTEWLDWKLTKIRLEEIIRRELRAMDTLMYDDHTDRMVLLCPEADIEGAGYIASHLKNAAERDLGIQIVMAMATFPEEALTFDGLLEQAYERLTHVGIPTTLNPILMDKHLSSHTKE